MRRARALSRALALSRNNHQLTFIVRKAHCSGYDVSGRTRLPRAVVTTASRSRACLRQGADTRRVLGERVS